MPPVSLGMQHTTYQVSIPASTASIRANRIAIHSRDKGRGRANYDISSQPGKADQVRPSAKLFVQRHHSPSNLALLSGLVNPTRRYHPQQPTATARLTYGRSGVLRLGRDVCRNNCGVLSLSLPNRLSFSILSGDQIEKHEDH